MAEGDDIPDEGEQSGKVLGDKDQFFFKAKGSWEGPMSSPISMSHF